MEANARATQALASERYRQSRSHLGDSEPQKLLAILSWSEFARGESTLAAIGFAARSVSILAALVIDALIGWGVAAWPARLSVAAALGLPALGLPALVPARRAVAQLRRRTSLALEALQRILAEAFRPIQSRLDDSPGSETSANAGRPEGCRERTDRRQRSNLGNEAGPLA